MWRNNIFTVICTFSLHHNAAEGSLCEDVRSRVAPSPRQSLSKSTVRCHRGFASSSRCCCCFLRLLLPISCLLIVAVENTDCCFSQLTQTSAGRESKTNMLSDDASAAILLSSRGPLTAERLLTRTSVSRSFLSEAAVIDTAGWVTAVSQFLSLSHCLRQLVFCCLSSSSCGSCNSWLFDRCSLSGDVTKCFRHSCFPVAAD